MGVLHPFPPSPRHNILLRLWPHHHVLSNEKGLTYLVTGSLWNLFQLMFNLSFRAWFFLQCSWLLFCISLFGYKIYSNTAFFASKTPNFLSNQENKYLKSYVDQSLTTFITYEVPHPTLLVAPLAGTNPDWTRSQLIGAFAALNLASRQLLQDWRR